MLNSEEKMPLKFEQKVPGLGPVFGEVQRRSYQGDVRIVRSIRTVSNLLASVWAL